MFFLWPYLLVLELVALELLKFSFVHLPGDRERGFILCISLIAKYKQEGEAVNH